MATPSQADYERRERAELRRRLDEVDKAPLNERKENLRDLEDMFSSKLARLRDGIETVAERVGWLLDGNYGYGSYLVANEIAANRRMNRVAALTQLTLALEWGVPPRMSAAWWNKLSAPAKRELNDAVQAEIDGHLSRPTLPPATPSRDRARRRRRTPRRRPRRDTEPRPRTPICNVGTEVQSVILDDRYFDARDARGWIMRHGFKATKVDRTDNSFRFRQKEPSRFLRDSFRTIRLRPGVQAVIGCPA